jgi:periplasmic divalent cation tolerance protein
MTDEYLQVTTTTDSRREAASLARSAVEGRLAACAQLVGPIASTYWWEGEVETADEWMVLFKTTAVRLEELAALITEEHSYDTPEIIATPVTAGGADYLDWVSEQTESDEVDDDEIDDDIGDEIDDGAGDEDGSAGRRTGVVDEIVAAADIDDIDDMEEIDLDDDIGADDDADTVDEDAEDEDDDVSVS